MFRSIFSIFLFIISSILSFYFTLIVISYLKDIDPIMKEIKKNKSLYEISSTDAYIDDVIIIPGLKGKSIDVNSSYKLMKRFGSFKEDLLVYKELLPLVSISNIYDKYVVSGNFSKKEVALIFKIEDTSYLEEIVTILKKHDIIGTFFIAEDIFYESINFLDLLYLNNQDIELLSREYSLLNIDRINFLLRNYRGMKINYCYSEYYDENILSVCGSKKIHTIMPTINTTNFPYNDIKNKLSNGAVIKLNNSSRVVYELDYIVNFIKQKDYKIVSLKRLLSE